MSMSKLDAVYRSILLTKFFTKGWGKPDNLRRLFEFRKIVSNRDECFKLIDPNYPVTITREQQLSDCHVLEGYFMSPLEKFLPGIVPEKVQRAHFQVILPLEWSEPGVKPVCLHLAGTGDHFYWRRRNLIVKPLMKEAGIGGIILENPFYGLRKPTDQIRSSLHNVSDIFVMGGCLILESLVLFHWCERQGLGPLGVTGLSMGGHMASLAATNWPKPLVLVPCLSWSTASAVFLQGVMSHSINWDLLEDQYLSDGVYREKLSKMVTIVDEPFLAGKKFARTFNEKVKTGETIPTSEKRDIPDTISNRAEDVKVPSEIPLDTTTTLDEILTEKDNLKDENKQGLQGDDNNNKLIFDNTPKLDSEINQINTEIETKNNKNPEKFMDDVVYSRSTIENFNIELKRLFQEGMLDASLFEKLTSNEKFELNAKDIENLNKLIGEDIRDLLMKYSNAPAADQPKLPLTEETINTDSSTQKEDSKSEPLTSDKTKKKNYWNVSELTHDWWNHLPFKWSSGKKIDIAKIHWRDREALQFMRGIMDECTHLSNFSVPYDTSLIIAVCAKHDAYVPREDVGRLEEIWRGAEVRYVEAGHVSAYILHQSVFRACIIEAFERSKKKWRGDKHIDT